MSDDEENIDIAENNDDIYEVADEEEVEEVEEDEFDDNIHQKQEEIREIAILPENMRMTTDRISLFEYTELIGARAMAIAQFNNCYVSIEGLTDPIQMAEREFRMRMCPLYVRRRIGTKVIDGVETEIYDQLYPNTAIHPQRANNAGGF
jgi:hypothetical protein